MQSVKVVVRQIGIPHAKLNVQSADDVSKYLEETYGSQGYVLQSTHYLGEVVNEQEIVDGQKGVQGYRFSFVFVKDGAKDSK